MRNFYYVVSFNLTNPLIKTMLSQQKITSMTGLMLDFKLRSKLFLSYIEAMTSVNEDFNNKLDSIYTDKNTHGVAMFTVANPSIIAQTTDIESMVKRFSGKNLSDWDENCVCAVFFADNNVEDDEEINSDPNSWLMKYEIFYTEDAIELSGNGNFLFSAMNVPQTQFTSTYH
jgi:hypothetical protein